jgi:hypothetical protein
MIYADVFKLRQILTRQPLFEFLALSALVIWDKKGWMAKGGKETIHRLIN